jgi:hypothetical protein
VTKNIGFIGPLYVPAFLLVRHTGKAFAARKRSHENEPKIPSARPVSLRQFWTDSYCRRTLAWNFSAYILDMIRV